MSYPQLIGVLHLAPLPGSPGAREIAPSEALQIAGAQAVQEAMVLAKMGFQGVILENFGDAPFYKDQVRPETVASMSIITAAIREAVGDIPVGVNVLRNDGFSALSIAAVTGADFIRVNVLSGVAATDQGIIEGKAAELIRERDRLQAPVSVFADVQVKHAVTLSTHDLGISIEDAVLRGRADGIIITGETTGRLASQETLETAFRKAKELKVPLYQGSGVTPENLSEVLNWVDGVIVGSALRKGGKAGAPLDQRNLTAFMKAYKDIAKVGSKKKKSSSTKKKSSKSSR